VLQSDNLPNKKNGMTRRAALTLLVTTLSGALMNGCGSPPDMPDYRYRLTVEVDTPQGLRRGSSVIQVHNELTYNPVGGGYSFGSEPRGEATAVDLPGGQTLFALLTGEEGSSYWAGRIVYDLAPKVPIVADKYDSSRATQLRNAVANRSVIVVPRKVLLDPNSTEPKYISRYPLLVTFTDIKNPKTVVGVDPTDLAKSFGAGIKLRRITVQITDDPVTAGIGKRLGWLKGHSGSVNPANLSSTDVVKQLSVVTDTSFSQGVSQ
jgi:hypothetical protein